MARSEQHTGDTPADPAAVRWRITSGSPEPEEVAAIAVALSAAMAARIAEATEEAREEGEEREAARWTPAAARRKAATSWTTGTRPGWRVSH